MIRPRGILKSYQQKKSKDHESESVWLVSYADMMTLLVGFFALLLSMSTIDSSKYEKIKKESTKVFGGEYVIPYEKLLAGLRDVVNRENLSEQVLFQETDSGVEITFQGALFFESGSVNLRVTAKELIEKLIPIIKDKAINYGIIIEGHTDDLPTSNGIVASNWELSSIRACTVLRLFESHGFRQEQLKAIGWGATKPKMPNTTQEHRAINRRVVIKITKENV